MTNGGVELVGNAQRTCQNYLLLVFANTTAKRSHDADDNVESA